MEPMSEAFMTSRETFRALATNHRVVPVVRKVLADGQTALSAYRKLAEGRPGTFLLESAAQGQSWDRWSYIGTGARCALTAKDSAARWIGEPPVDMPDNVDPLDAIRETLSALHTAPIEGLPPLTSGLVGFMSFDMIRYIEDLPDTGILHRLPGQLHAHVFLGRLGSQAANDLSGQVIEVYLLLLQFHRFLIQLGQLDDIFHKSDQAARLFVDTL